jgi:hypothetical protein
MTNPKFAQMTKAELRAYVLDNRDDQEAFYALADRISSSPHLQKLQPGERLEDVLPELIKRRQAQQ